MKREPLPKNTHNPTLQHPHKNRHNTQTVSLKTLHPEIILQLARQFTQQNPPPTTRGRKPKYPEALLLTLALMMTAQQHSYRTLLYWAKVFFPDTPLPCLSTLWYRLEAIPETRWHAFLSWLASLGIARERALRSEGAAEAGVEGGVGGWGEQSPRRGDGLTEYTSNEEERKRLLTLLDDVRKEYDEQIKKEVQRFFVYSYEEAAHTLLENYLDNVDAFCNKTKVRDPITNEEVDPDEKPMRSIEEQIGVSENAKREFREGIMRSVASLARRGVRFEIGSDERLREAIERKLFADLKDVVKITTSARTPDPEQLRKINDVIDRMVAHGGYTPESANEILRYVGALLNR